jgi:hypothetical protein
LSLVFNLGTPYKISGRVAKIHEKSHLETLDKVYNLRDLRCEAEKLTIHDMLWFFWVPLEKSAVILQNNQE